MASGDETKSKPGGRLHWTALVLAGVAVAGWLVILVVNKWHIGAPVVFLCLGWAALLLCGRTLWGSAQAAAGEGTGPDEAGFELSAGRVAELEKEKRALLKAIKEVEFDREMGKMSEQDAAEISRVYRARAIDILKELEGEDAATARNAPIGRVIEGEVRARLALAGVASRAKDKARAAKPAGTGETVSAGGPDASPGSSSASPPSAGSSSAGSFEAGSSSAGSSAASPSSAGSSEPASSAASPSAAGAAASTAGPRAGFSPGPAEGLATGAAFGRDAAGTSAADDASAGSGAGSAIDRESPAGSPGDAAAAGPTGTDAGKVGAAPSASASTGAPSPNKKKSKNKSKATRASDGSGGVAGSGSGGAGGAALQKREDA